MTAITGSSCRLLYVRDGGRRPAMAAGRPRRSFRRADRGGAKEDREKDRAVMRAILRMWTVYNSPQDYPDKFVARMFEVEASGSRPTASIVIAPTLDRLRDEMREMGLIRLKRSR